MQEVVIVAKVFVINADGLILTLRRSKTDPRRPLTWDLPGGMVDYGEDPSDAAKRELEEETGLKVSDVTVFATRTTNHNHHTTRLIYVTYTDDAKITLSFEHDQYKWVTKEEFAELDAPDHYKSCLDYLQKANS